jgi:hypothetical protein
MNMHDFIFSSNRWNRVTRHLIFWVCWFLFSGIVQISFNTTNAKDPLTNVWDIIYFQFIRSFARFPSILIFSYLIVYFLAPRFLLKKKYGQFAILFFLSVLLLYASTYACLYLCLEVFRINPFISHWPVFAYLFNSYYSNINFTGAVPTCCLILAIKYYKDWYVKQLRSEQLGKENIQAELQLLKAQIHPHFLFNTLNNIYSFVLNNDNRAAGLVDKLTGMIDYMRTECENALVPLVKETTLIKDYVGLEKVRYGNRLRLEVNINCEDEDQLIAPLLMIPFVENSFKHGTSQMLLHPWVKLQITCVGRQLFFELSNSKPSLAEPNKMTKGIGLYNVKKRLQLLYPGRYQLQIYSTEDSFNVSMQLVMEEYLQPHKTTAYA